MGGGWRREPMTRMAEAVEEPRIKDSKSRKGMGRRLRRAGIRWRHLGGTDRFQVLPPPLLSSLSLLWHSLNRHRFLMDASSWEMQACDSLYFLCACDAFSFLPATPFPSAGSTFSYLWCPPDPLTMLWRVKRCRTQESRGEPDTLVEKLLDDQATPYL